MNKKIVAVVSAAVAALSVVGCDGGNNGVEGHSGPVRIVMPDGAPAVALAQFMAEGYDNTEFTVVQSSTIVQEFTSGNYGNYEMAIMPVNAAATLYNKDAGVKLLTVNTHGNLFFVGDGDEIEPNDLIGKRIAVIGEGAVPDYTLRMVFGELEIRYVKSTDAVSGSIAVQYAADGAAVIGLLQNGLIDYGFLAEPAATTAANKLGKSIVLDAQELWADTFGTAYPQACLVATADFARTEGDYIKEFMSAMQGSEEDEWAKNNPQAAVTAIGEHMKDGSATTVKTLTADIIERCNIETVFAPDAKTECELFFTKLMGLNNEFDRPVLSALPDDGFYYGL